MLKSEGYMMFRGTATIQPVNGKPMYQMTGDWLYKPEYGCWFVNGRSFPKEIVVDIKEEVG